MLPITRRTAYAKSGDVVPVAFSIFYQTFGKKELSELPKLSDVIKDFDVHKSISDIRLVIIDLALKKLQRHEEDSAPGLWCQWNTNKFNIRDVTSVKANKIGAGVDLDGPVVAEYGPHWPYLMTYGKTSAKDKTWKPPKGVISLRVIIADDEYERYEQAVEQYSVCPLFYLTHIQQTHLAYYLQIESEAEVHKVMLVSTRPRATHSTSLSGAHSIPSQESHRLSPPPHHVDESPTVTVLSDPKSLLDKDLSKRARSNSMMKTPPRESRRDPTEWQSPSANILRLGPSQAGRVSENQNIATTTMQGRLAFVPSHRAIQEVLTNSSLLRLELNDIMVPGALAGPTPGYPPSTIFQAPIVVTHKPDPISLKGSPVDRAFLVEEIIVMDDTDSFVKYIHNGNANPNDQLIPNDPDYPKAEFLSAIQHLQYEKMHRLVYVSDFQGYGDLLTDAQLMTSP
ncbi:hypothetical protein AAF712_015623 [Marasmius tenuissimus]|uniref:Alpha-type protein kinase domain-containing protein n=2 Tax=Marasmius tenuissimus TaxID=585030 RepID=A0ABR2Z7R3_9AGAR